MKLKDIKTLSQVANESGESRKTLILRLSLPGFGMVEGEDFLRLGDRQPILLSPAGVEKVLKNGRKTT